MSFNPNIFNPNSSSSSNSTAYNEETINNIVEKSFVELSGDIMTGTLALPNLALYGYNPYIRFPNGTTITSAPHEFDKTTELLNVVNTYNENQNFKKSINLMDGNYNSSLTQTGDGLLLTNLGGSFQFKTNSNNPLTVTNSNTITNISDIILTNNQSVNTNINNIKTRLDEMEIIINDVNNSDVVVLMNKDTDLQNQINDNNTDIINLQNTTQNTISLLDTVITKNTEQDTRLTNIENSSNNNTSTLGTKQPLITTNSKLSSSLIDFSGKVSSDYIDYTNSNLRYVDITSSLNSLINSKQNNLPSNINYALNGISGTGLTIQQNLDNNNNNIGALQTQYSNLDTRTTNNLNSINSNTTEIININDVLIPQKQTRITPSNRLDAGLIGSGATVSNASFGCLVGCSSNIQNQISNLQNAIDTNTSNIGILTTTTTNITDNTITYPFLKSDTKVLNANIIYNPINEVTGQIYNELYIGYIDLSGIDYKIVPTISVSITRKIVNSLNTASRLPNLYDKSLIYTVKDINNNVIFQTPNLTPTKNTTSYNTNVGAITILPTISFEFNTTGITQYNIYGYTEYQYSSPVPLSQVWLNASPQSLSNNFNINTSPSTISYNFNVMNKTNLCSNTAGIINMDDVITNRMRVNGLNFGIQTYPNNTLNQELNYCNLVAINTTPNSTQTSSLIVKKDKYPVGFSFEFRKIYNSTPITIQFEGAVGININDYPNSTANREIYQMSSTQEYLKFTHFYLNCWYITGYS